MENNMMSQMQQIKQKIDSLPEGSYSASHHYWCMTCKKFFVLDKPVCPFMTGMCVNTPIAVENMPPENTESLEKFGLFYPKIAQHILSNIIEKDFFETGKKLAQVYLDFLREWRFNLSKEQPLQTMKSFIIITTGCEIAQRINEKSVTFVLMDAQKIWDKNKVSEMLKGALDYLSGILSFKKELNIDFIDIFGPREIGKYYCSKCGMFFEFGIKRETITCPLMPQKCMFDPQHIEKVSYSSEKFAKQFEIAPDIYKRLISCIPNKKDFSDTLKQLLHEWKITDNFDRIIATLIPTC